MIGLFGTALDNIVEQYKSRFRPDPLSESMLFLANEQAIPARLSYELYEQYLSEFEAFIKSGRRKLFMQAALIVVLFFAAAIAVVYFYGIDLIDNEQYEPYVAAAFMACWTLPLAFRLLEGIKLFNKPKKELTVLPDGIALPLTSRQRMDRRFMGMSYGMLGLAVIAPIAGIVIELTGELPITKQDINIIMIYSAVILGAIYAWRRKSRAHREDEEINASQRPVRRALKR